MKVKNVRPEFSEIITTENDDIYKRHSVDSWERLFGATWEPLFGCTEIEKAYQEYVDDMRVEVSTFAIST